GTLVTGIHYRHPAVLANMAASLDIVSGGRLEVGVGAGWNEEESGAYGIELGSPKERSDRFEEACEVLVGLLSQETTSFDGTYFHLTEARCSPPPVQKPHPPICIGGSGEQRTLRTAARFAQHWNFVGGTPAEFVHKREVLHEHCAAVGRDPSEITLSSHVVYAGDAGQTAAQAAEMAAVGCELAIVTMRPPHKPEDMEPLAEALSGVNS
ncbi:MAG TPA: LLM class flavin-dependent oxidoreductase, partial [Acidimicrobiales bacterium]|nr:LLM class flavin-dependent oxidoreductase [Acidimicrobiales bacterium]